MASLDKQFLSIRQAAKYLGVSEVTLRRWHNNGSFRATFLSPGGHRHYSLADLEKKTKGLFRIAQEWASAEVPYSPPEEFYCSTSDRFKIRHENMLRLIEHSPSQEIAALISSTSGEIGNNSFDHNLGNWPDLAGIFFAYDLGKRTIVLADRGVGVLSTLQRIRPELKTHAEALQVAFTEVITGRAPEHRGNGLKYVKEAVAAARASLEFQSGDAILEIKKKEPGFKIKKAETFVRGCLVLIEF